MKWKGGRQRGAWKSPPRQTGNNIKSGGLGCRQRPPAAGGMHKMQLQTSLMWLPICLLTRISRQVESSGLHGEAGAHPMPRLCGSAPRMYLPQPVAACLRTPPDTTPVPTIVPAVLPGDSGTATCLLARWKCLPLSSARGLSRVVSEQTPLRAAPSHCLHP